LAQLIDFGVWSLRYSVANEIGEQSAVAQARGAKAATGFRTQKSV
jgi:hypothetical protein